jgi:hypothetical protein
VIVVELVSAYISTEVKGVSLIFGDFIVFTFLGAGLIKGFFVGVYEQNEIYRYLVIHEGDNNPQHYDLSHVYGINAIPAPARFRR